MFGIALRRQNKKAERAAGWAAFEDEALPHLQDLFRVAMWLTGERSAAEDLVQDTFTQALQSFHRYERGTNCRSWLVTIMYHLNSKRRRAAGKLHLASSDDEERIAETVAFTPPTPQNITEEEVLAALRTLPAQFQETVILADVEELSYKEIAEAMDVPIGTVMSRLARARKLLRTQLIGYANTRGLGRQEQPSDQPTAKNQGGKSNAVS